MVTDEFLKALPESPGVYIMKSEDDTVIYVGKAKILIEALPFIKKFYGKTVVIKRK